MLNQFLSKDNKKKILQISTLYSSMVIGMIVGIAISVVNTRFLGPESYGDFKFIQGIVLFAISFLTLGYFYSGSRLVAKSKKNNEKKRFLGSLLFVSLIIYILFFILLFAFSYYEESIFDNDIGYYFRIAAFLVIVYPLQLMLENFLTGSNQIGQLSVVRLAPKIIYLGLAGYIGYNQNLTLLNALILFHLAMFVVFIVIVLLNKPSIKSIKFYLSRLHEENKSFGVHIYIGAITGVASSQLGSISIGYFMNNIQVGYFSLAITASMPLTLIPSTVGTTFFREFAKTNKISKKIFLTTLLVSLSSLTLFLIFIKPLISLLYSDEFLPVVDLAYYISIGAMFHGLGDFFNRFLSAQGKGVYLKRVNIFLGVFNLLGYILFVYIWSLQGAVYTRLISGILYFLLMLVFYSLHLKHGR